jgi:hypothetical protein
VAPALALDRVAFRLAKAARLPVSAAVAAAAAAAAVAAAEVAAAAVVAVAVAVVVVAPSRALHRPAAKPEHLGPFGRWALARSA